MNVNVDWGNFMHNFDSFWVASDLPLAWLLLTAEQSWTAPCALSLEVSFYRHPIFHAYIWYSFNLAKFTKLISNARIVTFRIVTFFQKNPNGSKVRKSDIFSIFEQNMCRVLVVWGCRVLVVFFLSISGNGWLMNSTACIYAQKLKHFYIMKTYLCNVSSCSQFSLQVSTTIVQLFSHVWSWWCVCEWERLREDLREAQDASNYNNSNNHNKQQQ